MTAESPGAQTQLLARVREGDQDAAAELFDLLYGQLRSVAGGLFSSQRASHTLQPTALVHEAYMKMIRPSASGAGWRDRAHFFAVAATAMRQVLVNHARDRAAQKRGGAEQRDRVTLSDVPVAGQGAALDALAVHEALESLAAADARQARVAELRFFAGLTSREVAEVLGVSLRTVELDWTLAKSWLARTLAPPESRG